MSAARCTADAPRVGARWAASVLYACVASCAAPGGEDTPKGDTDTVVVDDTDALAPWQTVAIELPGAVLSVTGAAADDVWMMGSADALGPTVLHYDGASWERVLTGTVGDLWWGWMPPAPSASRVWAVGAGGRVLRYDGASWEETVTDPAITLFGIWGAAEDDVWTVGGDIGGAGVGAAVFHFDGAAWTREPLPSEAAGLLSVFKVWGTAADDVWICGEDGTVLHFDGVAWTAVATGTDRTLLTVNGGGPDDVYAVGGVGNAAVIHWDGATWFDESPPFAPELNGVFVRDGRVVGVGRTGTVWEKDGAGAWVEDPRGRAGFFDLHATWLDPDGGLWAVGGAIATSPLTRGTIVYGGPASVPAFQP